MELVLDKKTLEHAITVAWNFGFNCKHTKAGRIRKEALNDVIYTLEAHKRFCKDFWVARIEGDGGVGKIRIGIKKVRPEYGKFILVADNGDDVSQGGFGSREGAMQAIGEIWEDDRWQLEWLNV